MAEQGVGSIQGRQGYSAGSVEGGQCNINIDVYTKDLDIATTVICRGTRLVASGVSACF